MKETTKMIVASCLFAILGVGTAFAPHIAIRNLCYFLALCICAVYSFGSVLILTDMIGLRSGIEKTAETWEDMYSPIPEIIILVCSVGIISLIAAGKFVLGVLSIFSLVVISAYVIAINNYRKEKGLR